MATIKAVLIPIDGEIQDIEIELGDDDGLTAVKKIVRGYVEGIRAPWGGMLLLNEKAKDMPLEHNERASALMGGRLRRGDWIAGEAVLIGPPGPQGQTTHSPLGAKEVREYVGKALEATRRAQAESMGRDA